MQKEEKKSQHKIRIIPLRDQSSFNKANKLGKKNHSAHMVLITYIDKSFNSFEDSLSSPHCINNNSENLLQRIPIHLGLKIPKKLGNAVTRNKIRRRIKSVVHNLHTAFDLPFIKNRVIVIIPRKNIENFKYHLLQDEIFKILSYHRDKSANVIK